MIYFIMYFMLNLFGAMQINSWVKWNFGSWDELVEILRFIDSDGIEGYTNKEIISAIGVSLFIAGFIIWITSFWKRD